MPQRKRRISSKCMSSSQKHVFWMQKINREFLFSYEIEYDLRRINYVILYLYPSIHKFLATKMVDFLKCSNFDLSLSGWTANSEAEQFIWLSYHWVEAFSVQKPVTSHTKFVFQPI